MGCGGSKVDDLPLVIRCRARKELIKSAMDYRYDLSSSHLAYFHSLKHFGYSLSKFVDEQVVFPSSYASSPVLTLPSDDGEGKVSSSISHIHSINGNQDSHLHLSSESESDLHSVSSNGHIHMRDDSDIDDQDNIKPPLSSFSPPYNHYQTNWDDPFVIGGRPPEFGSAWGPYGGIFDSYRENSNSNLYYMKKSAPTSHTVIHEEETRGFQEAWQWPLDEPMQQAPSPPPPPHKVSGWDFLNFFDGYENGYQNQGYNYESVVSSSPDTSELREREGIPDLEEETENESLSEQVNTVKVKKSNTVEEGTPNFIPKDNIEVNSSKEPTRSIDGSSNSIPSLNNEGSHIEIDTSTSTPETVLESVGEKKESSKEVSFEDERSMHEVESSKLSSLTTLSATGSRDFQEVFNEIKNEFEIAFRYGKEVAFLLETGKVPHRSKFSLLKVPLSRILYLVLPSFSWLLYPKQSEIKKLATSYNLDAVTDVKSINLSSTMEKLYAWENRLYREVKDEERLRLTYDNMCKKLKDLDARGAESSKIDVAQASIRKLLTKLDVSIKAIDAISTKIQKLRDEELQPQICELIYGFIRMWRLILKCHQKQYLAVMASKTWNLKANPNSQDDAILELKTRLLTWCKHFDNWIKAQKSYVNSINGWLEQCIDHEPEVTIDGVIPFSPSRIGAPPIFIMCNDWQNGVKHVSEENILTAVNLFALSLKKLLERKHDEQNQRLKTEQFAKDFSENRQYLMDHEMKNDVKIELNLLKRNTNEARLRHKESVKLLNDAASSTLDGGMIPLFKALHNFTCDALKAHEQVRLMQNHVKGTNGAMTHIKPPYVLVIFYHDFLHQVIITPALHK